MKTDLNPKDLAITMSYDAMRICLGLEPHNHPVCEVLRWMDLMSRTKEDFDVKSEPPADLSVCYACDGTGFTKN